MPGFELIGKEEQEAVKKIFDDGGILFAHGFEKLRRNFHIREFEKMFRQKINCSHSLAVSSGTAAIKIGLKALGVKPGDEVITQAFNFMMDINCGYRIMEAYGMNRLYKSNTVLEELKEMLNK